MHDIESCSSTIEHNSCGGCCFDCTAEESLDFEHKLDNCSECTEKTNCKIKPNLPLNRM